MHTCLIWANSLPAILWCIYASTKPARLITKP